MEFNYFGCKDSANGRKEPSLLGSFAERSLSYEKIVQTRAKRRTWAGVLQNAPTAECSLSYEKIVQMRAKSRTWTGVLQNAPTAECSLSSQNAYIALLDYLVAMGNVSERVWQEIGQKKCAFASI